MHGQRTYDPDLLERLARAAGVADDECLPCALLGRERVAMAHTYTCDGCAQVALQVELDRMNQD